MVHVLGLSETLPHDQDFYDQQAEKEQVLLLADASRLGSRGTYGDGRIAAAWPPVSAKS